jgi:hypothetical protein
MKKYSKSLILIALFSVMAILFINAVSAATFIPIGGASQLYPFESQPTAVEAGSRIIGFPVDTLPKSYDGDTDSKTNNIDFTAGYCGFASFEKPSDTGGTDFTIGYVDFKMRYSSVGSIDDEYRIVFYVGTSGPVVLKPWCGGSGIAVVSMGSDVLAETWGNQSKPGGGAWTWADIADIKFRFETQVVGPVDPSFKYSNIHEVWLSVYPTPPPEASTTISVMPTAVETLTQYDTIFVDLYVTNKTYDQKLQAYQVELLYDSVELYAIEAYTYWPFTAVIDNDLTTPGLAKIGYFIPTTTPIVDAGYNGSYPIARIYFYVMSTGYSWLTYDLTKLVAPGGVYLPHADWDGVYGTPPAGTHLIRWTSASEFPWTAPVCTYWYEIWPDPGREWHLTSHETNQVDPPPNGELDASDQIDMMEEPPGEELWWFHVDEVGQTVHDPSVPPGADPYSVYMFLTFKHTEPVPEFPLGLGLIMLLAPIIPVAYLWRLRKKVPKQ